MGERVARRVDEVGSEANEHDQDDEGCAHPGQRPDPQSAPLVTH